MKNFNFLKRAILMVSALLMANGLFAQTNFNAWEFVKPGSPGMETGSLTFTEKDITIEFWLNIPEESFNNGVTILSSRHSENAGFSIDINSDQVRAFFANSTSDNLPGIANGNFILFLPKEAFVGKWGHIAFVVSSTDDVVRSYLNGELYEDVKNTTTGEQYPIDWIGNFRPSNGANVGVLRIGFWYAETAKLYGKIADLRIWSVGRTTEQIKANYNKNLIGTNIENPGLYINHRFTNYVRPFPNEANPSVSTNQAWPNPAATWQTVNKVEILSAYPQNLAVADETLSWATSAGEWEVTIFKKEDNTKVFVDTIATNSIVLNTLSELEETTTYYAKVRTLNNGVFSGLVTSADFTVDKNGTSLNETVQDVAFSVVDGSLIVKAEKAQTLNIYTVAGQLVRSVNLVAGENTISGLAKGFYLANKNKVIIK